MPINKTEEFLYFQNKAKHYDTIKNIKPAVKDKLQSKFIQTIRKQKCQNPSPKKNSHFGPLIRQIQIKQENQNLINRIFKIFNSQRTQVNTQGNYSRYHHDMRKFRAKNPYQDQISRTIQIGNNGLNQRIKKIKPRIGNSQEWSKHFGKTLSLKKNMSRFLLESNKSKTNLHISVVDNYVPKYYQAFLRTSSVIDFNAKENQVLPQNIEITQDGLLTLPDIKSKQSHPAHCIRRTKDFKKLIFDKSQSSLYDNHKKSRSSIDSFANDNNHQTKTAKIVGNTQNKQKRRQLQFKFSEINPEIVNYKQKNLNKQFFSKKLELQLSLKYEKQQNQQQIMEKNS